jgi:hypothetical protein
MSFILQKWQNQSMKFFEQMDSIEQEKVALRAVGGSVAIEGMHEAAQACWDQLEVLENTEQQQAEIMVQESNQQRSVLIGNR